MKRAAIFLLALALCWAGTSAAQSLGVSADRIAEILRKEHFAFEGAQVQPHPAGAGKGFVLQSLPKDRPAMTIRFYGDRAAPSAIAFEYADVAALQDHAGERVLGELVRLLMPALGPAPSWRGRDDAGKEIDPLYRWSSQILVEIDLGDFLWQPLRAWHAGGRVMFAFREPEARKTGVVAFYVGPPLEPDWEPSVPPRHPTVASALADYATGHYDRALAALRPLAAADEAEGQAWLFDAMYRRRTDIGVTLDPERMKRDDAARTQIALGLEAAAAKGEPHALYWSAIRDGREMLEEREAGFAARAARLGHAGAQFHWARHLLRERASEAEGALWMEIAARQGHWLSAFAAGKIYEDGMGRAKNAARAYFWYRVFETRLGALAAVDGEYMSAFGAKAGADLDPAERAKLDAEVARWRPAAFADIVKDCAAQGCPKDLRQ